MLMTQNGWADDAEDVREALQQYEAEADAAEAPKVNMLTFSLRRTMDKPNGLAMLRDLRQGVASNHEVRVHREPEVTTPTTRYPEQAQRFDAFMQSHKAKELSARLKELQREAK
jgi:hypothetical protein